MNLPKRCVIILPVSTVPLYTRGNDKAIVLIILHVGVQIPLLGEPQGLLEHLLCVRLEDKLLTQAEYTVAVFT